ncbi:hypothetical protein MASR1M49_35380 [Pararhodobacter aggregans]
MDTALAGQALATAPKVPCRTGRGLPFGGIERVGLQAGSEVFRRPDLEASPGDTPAEAIVSIGNPAFAGGAP